MTLPTAIRPFVEFPTVLRNHGFSISPGQTIGFIEAIGLLGPRNMSDIYRAAIAMLSIPNDRIEEFDALYRTFFLGQTISAPADSDDEDVDAYEPTGQVSEVEESDEEEVGGEATATERLSSYDFADRSDTEELLRFERLAPARLPRRTSYRRAPASHGDKLNMRKTLQEAVRRDGELFTLAETRRKTRQRRIILLIDVSGSMKDRTDATIRFAHALGKASDRYEAFTLGTRLTRITSALSVSNAEQALSRVGSLVADFDGGTRIGDALQAFLAIPRYAGFARGAAVIVLSDGLERGDPMALIDAVRRLSRLAWRVDWLSPLAAEEGFQPETEALSAIFPYLDSLSDGSDTQAICSHVLNLARAA